MKRYTYDEKVNALKRAEEIGFPKASKELNISYASLLDWRKKANSPVLPEGQSEEQETQEALEPTVSTGFPLELEVQMLRQENALLRLQLAQRAKAIHALTPVEE